MEIGISTFAESTPDPTTGRTVSAGERLRDVVEEIVRADEVGLDVYAIGEPGVPAVRDARPAVRRPRGDHGGPRIVHRVLCAVRLRP